MPMVARSDGTIKCAYPGEDTENDGPTMEDGNILSIAVYDNTCDGGLPPPPNSQGTYTGHMYEQYHYNLSITQGGANSTEFKDEAEARAWVCGELAYDNGPSSWGGEPGDLYTSWFDYGNADPDKHCFPQFDFTVTVNGWDGDSWSGYLNESSIHCDFECS
jgi:hypothetical protein